RLALASGVGRRAGARAPTALSQESYLKQYILCTPVYAIDLNARARARRSGCDRPLPRDVSYGAFLLFYDCPNGNKSILYELHHALRFSREGLKAERLGSVPVWSAWKVLLRQ